MHISIVSPVYKAEGIVGELVSRLKQSLSIITNSFEIILVEDGSPDNSWKKIAEETKKDSRVKGYKLSRNFGQHYAITAGLEQSSGEWVVVMDCDLQDQPEEIIKLYQKAAEGYDIVLARRNERQDNFFKKYTSRIFYAVLAYLTGVKQDSTIANFGIYKRTVVNSICKMQESIRYFPTMVKWVGFNSTEVNVKHAERFEGRTSYNFSRLLNLAIDIMLAFSDKPIRLVIRLGLIISLGSFLFAIYNLARAIKGEIEVTGYASLIVSIWFLSGIIILILGVIGLYIGKTFEGVKKRPHYIISESI